MLECYLYSHAKNLSGSRAPIDYYVYKGDYSNHPEDGKRESKAEEQKGRVAKGGKELFL